ncbi:hypothetical protein [Flavobacterium psychrotrophum]|uniref:hypothetical protein n=1 Tax=Flavobacterium psychrotrophum TaxID=2294119 RepID=UPI000E320006|nr:hypothetical protein [Flavobacterium psychrotrophum]
MKKSALILLASLALWSCRQTGHGENGVPDNPAESSAAGVTPAPTITGTEQPNREGEPNVVDSAAQDTTHNSAIKPKPKNEITPSDITKPKR